MRKDDSLDAIREKIAAEGISISIYLKNLRKRKFF
jgi:hypothetical protein